MKVCVACAIALAIPGVAQAAELAQVDQGESPVHMASPPSDPSRLFVVEKDGWIDVIDHGRKQRTPFLDIRDRVRTGGLRGLLSMAFAPDYGRSRRFYVFYSGDNDLTRIEEYRRSRRNPNRAMRSTRRSVLTIRLPGFTNPADAPHLGGQLAFGPDDYLYISTGDGSRGFQDSRLTRAAQQRRSLLGKLLRIDPTVNGRAYGIPDDNPYVGRRGRDEIWARGLRNPWRFSFDRGRLFLADTSEATREEVNIVRLRRSRGANFGWPRFEGTHRLSGGPRRGLTFPAFEYPHRSDNEWGADCTAGVIGGFVVRDWSVPSLYGRYVYGDYCFFEVRSFDPARPHRSDRLEFETTPPNSFGVDATGRVFAAFEGGLVAQLVEGE